MADCKNCVLRQPTDDSAPCFDPENPLHYECAVDSDFWPDRAEICPDRTENAFGPYYLTVEIPDLDRTRKELTALENTVQAANNYLSGGGGGARSVQHAAELWGRVCAAEDKPKVCPHCNHSPCLGQIESDDCVTA